MSAPFSRRAFVSTGALAVAGLTLGMRPLAAPRTVLPDPLDPQLLRQLAMRAMDAATSAGATYADIRVGEMQRLLLGKSLSRQSFYSDLQMTCSYGIRALVDGAWGFAHGDGMTIDAVVGAARSAVTQARTAAGVAASRVELVPAPIATGEWRTPIVIDPFAVPLHEQMALLLSWVDVSSQVWGAGGPSPSFNWRRETRVFASSDGALVTQTLDRAGRDYMVASEQMMGGGPVQFAVPMLFATSGGYETVQDPRIDDRIKALAEDAHRYAALPARTLDVGRYPAVFDGVTLAAVIARTLGPALEMDRALGDEADATGTSYLVPVMTQLGAQVVSPLLTVIADRASPSVTSVKWDDEGVEPVAGAVIEAGRLVDYQTSRGTAGALEPWYRQHRSPVASRGCAVALDAGHPVQVRTGHLTLTPSATTATLEDLIRDMAHGIVVRQGTSVATDQQLTTGSLNASGGTILEVVRGKIARRVKNVGLQWNTLPLLRGVTALGDRSTVADETHTAYKGQPWHPAFAHSTAPAAAFREVNVVDTGRPV